MAKVKIRRLQGKFALSLLKKSPFLRHRFKYFIQVNQLYILSPVDEEQKEISVSAVINYKKVKSGEEVKYIIKFEKTSSVLDSKLTDLTNELQSLLRGEVTEVINSIFTVTYTVLTARESEYFDLWEPFEVIPRDSINISKYALYWQLDNHMAIVGASGSGKTYLVFSVLRKLQSAGAGIVILDNKFDELEDKADKFGIKANSRNIKQSVEYIKFVSQIVDKRYLEKKKDHQPLVLVIDEFSSFKSHLYKKEYAEVEKNLKNIILKGRRAKVVVCMIYQYQNSTSGLPMELLSSIHYKILLGNDVQNYKNFFEISKEPDLLTKGIGEGYYQVNGGEIKSFYVPHIIDNKAESEENLEGLKVSKA